MAGTTFKLGVEYSQFKQGMNEAKESVKTLTSQLKANESQLKLTGDQEIYLKNKVELLKNQIDAQRLVVANAQKALAAMEQKGVQPLSTQYQKMKKSVYDATDQLNKMQVELKNVESGADKAGDEAGEMNSELKNIGKGIGWQNVTDGLNSVISKLESGARAAVNFGKKILSSAKDSTQWADEIKTTVAQYADMGLTTDNYQRMKKVEDFIDTPVEAILTAKQRMQRATSTSGGVKAFEEVLGINLNGQSAEELFWETGEALMNMGEAFDKEAAAQQIFGRSWRELLPLFKTGREEYERMLTEQNVLTDDQVEKLARADDALKQAEQQIADLKNQFWAENADKITGLMQWFVDNKDAVVTALTAIGGAFGAMKLTSFAGDLMKVVSGFKALGWIKGGGEAAAAAGNALTTGGGAGLATKISNMLTSNAGLAGTAALLGIPMIDKLLNGDLRTADEIEKDMMRTIGGQNVVDIYEKIQQQGLARRKIDNPDWRPSYMQDQSYYGGPGRGSETVQTGAHGRGVSTFDNYSASLERMASEAAETSANTQRIAQNSVTSADIQTLTGLPAAVAQAVQAGMRTVTIVIGAGAVDAIGTRVSGNMANQVLALTK